MRCAPLLISESIGCQVAQIIKSLVFVGGRSGLPILILVSGANRVDEKVIEKRVAEPIDMADAEFVRRKTGFAIGGVPPVGHKEKIKTYIDRDLFQHEYVWAAAGTPHTVFRLASRDIERISQGEVITVG